MLSLQADLETILDQFNLTELVFEHEPRRIVKYLVNVLAPASFKSVIVTKMTVHENKRYKNEVVPFCSWVTKVMREFMTWERSAQAATTPESTTQPLQPRVSGRGQQRGRSGGGGGRGGGRGGQTGHDRYDGGRGGRTNQESAGAEASSAPVSANTDTRLAQGLV
jgi:hypothetical protein